MRLAPRQLQRSGMTGAVPYYGGRFTPAQAYAASHAAPPPPPARAPAPADPAATRQALQHLLDTGVLTQDEHDELVARTAS
jgi:hypothetical protein